MPDLEVVVKPKRRQFTAEYKRCILQEAGAFTQPGAGDVLNIDNLFSSSLSYEPACVMKGR